MVKREYHCVDCGKQVANPNIKRCQKCYHKHRIGRHHSKNTIEKIRRKAIKRYKNPEYKKRWKDGINKRTKDPNWRKSIYEVQESRRGSEEWTKLMQEVVIKRKKSGNWEKSMKDNPLWKRGKENPNWKGGHDSEVQRARKDNRYAIWRKSIFERDNYTCQKCGIRGGSLHAHHIKDWASNKALRFDIENGLTVCVPCHRKIHGHYIPDNGIVTKMK